MYQCMYICMYVCMYSHQSQVFGCVCLEPEELIVVDQARVRVHLQERTVCGGEEALQQKKLRPEERETGMYVCMYVDYLYTRCSKFTEDYLMDYQRMYVLHKYET